MVWPSEPEAAAWLTQQGVPAGDVAVLLRAAGGRPEDALAYSRAGVDAKYVEIDTEFGHSASGREWAKWGPALGDFLAGLRRVG